jgi:hypothetical protein
VRHKHMDDPESHNIRRTRNQKWNEIAAGPLQEIPHPLRYQHSSNGAPHPSNSHHRAHHVRGEKIRSEREEVGGKSLMRCAGEADEKYRRPETGNTIGEHDWHDR